MSLPCLSPSLSVTSIDFLSRSPPIQRQHVSLELLTSSIRSAAAASYILRPPATRQSLSVVVADLASLLVRQAISLPCRRCHHLEKLSIYPSGHYLRGEFDCAHVTSRRSTKSDQFMASNGHRVIGNLGRKIITSSSRFDNPLK